MLSIDEAEKIKTVVENKDYIVQLVNTVAKTMIEAFENLKIEDVNMFQLGYNKAIDDFVKELKNHYTEYNIDCVLEDADFYSYTTACNYLEDYIDEIAEHLKAGGENGTDNQ